MPYTISTAYTTYTANTMHITYTTYTSPTQVIRWFSGVDNVHASESAALLDSLMAGLSNPSDSTLRNQVGYMTISLQVYVRLLEVYGAFE
jgi:hypothetical protein